MPKGFSFFLCLVILQIPLLSVGQEWNYPYQHIGKEDGLPSNTVYCITSDQNNFLWIGTDAGLVKYDGVNYKVYTTKDGLPSNDVFEVVCDKYNRIWITSFKGEAAFIKNDRLFNSSNSQLLISLGNLKGFPRYIIGSNGYIWLITLPFSLYKIMDSSVTKIPNPFNIELGSNISEYNQKIYISTPTFTAIYDYNNDKFSKSYDSINAIKTNGIRIIGNKLFFLGPRNQLQVTSVSDLEQGRIQCKSLEWNIPYFDSAFWVLDQKGYNVIDPNSLDSKEKHMRGENLSWIYHSNLGDIWFSSLTNGIFKLRNRISQNYQTKNSTLSCTCIKLLKRCILIGTKDGRVFKFNRSSKLKIGETFIKPDINRKFKIIKFLAIDNDVYVIYERGIFSMKLNSESSELVYFNNSSIKNVFTNSEFLTVLDNDGVSRLDQNFKIKTLKVFPRIKRFYSFTKYLGKEIYGSQDSLYFLNGVLEIYPLNIPFDYRAMDLDVHDSLLIATTAEKGIFIIKDHTVLKNLNLDNGMVTNTCNNTIVYKNTLFTATNHGIHIYDIAKDSLSYFFESDGLASNNVSDLAIDADTLYAATENGLSVIPLSVLTPRKPFPCFLQPIYTATDTLWDTPDTIQTRTDQVVFATLNGLSFTSKIPVRFYYRIRGQDTSYRETREQNLELRFDKPGYHTFEAYAVNGDLQKSEFVTLTVFVDPYFYQTIWFKILMVLLGIGLLGTTYFVLLYLARKRSKSKHETANKMHVLELTAWRSTVHPHFLFNAMNTMLGLLQNSNFDSANQYIFEFSKMLRKTIDQSGKIMVTIEEEENYLTNYLEFEKAKRNGNLNFEIVIDNTSVRDFFIPSMVIQPILENALKHGLKPRKRGKIRIEFYIKGEFMVAEIRDNGIGFDSELGMAKAGSKGLKLIYDKLNIVEKVLKTKIPLDFKNLTDYKGNITGTQTVFQFPLLNDISHIPGLLPHQDEKANP